MARELIFDNTSGVAKASFKYPQGFAIEVKMSGTAVINAKATIHDDYEPEYNINFINISGELDAVKDITENGIYEAILTSNIALLELEIVSNDGTVTVVGGEVG